MFKHFNFYLFLIVLLGFLVRFVGLTSNPPSLNWDEVSHGYNAYSILKTGMDEWGQRFPIFNFRAYGDYPTTLNLYLTIPFIILFGLTDFSVRFPHVVYGTLTIISVYFLTYGLTKRKDVSVLTAFLVSVTPWYIFTSRFVLQSNLSVLLITTALAFFFNREKNKFNLGLFLFFLTLSLFSYHTTRIFSPILMLGVVLIYLKDFSSKLNKLLIVLFFSLSIFILVNPNARARSNSVFLIDQGAINKIVDARNNSKLPFIFQKILYNRPIYFIKEFSKNYVQYFSPKFLFLSGGTQYQFSVPNSGLLNLTTLPFYYLGIVFLFKNIKNKDYKFLLYWLLIFPIPASITLEKMAVVRSTTLLPLSEIVTVLGLYFLVDKINRKYQKVVVGIFILLTVILLSNYLYKYFNSYRKEYSWSWQYGYKEVVKYSKEKYQSYDKIVVTKKYGEPHEFFLFYMNWNPYVYQHDSSAIKFNQSGWWWVDRFDKFYFVNDWQVKDMKLESGGEIDCNKFKCLLFTSPGNYPTNWKKIDTIEFLDDKPAFEIYENK